MDGLTALMAHISHLGISDLDQILAQCDSAGAGAGSSAPSDEELALSLFAQEAQGLLHIAKDHVLDVDHGQDSDDLLDELLDMEETAEYDRAVALALSQGRAPPPRPARRNRPRRRGQHQGSRRVLLPFVSDA